MTTCDYDFFVIGGGSGGVRAARVAAQHGAKVALAEPGLLGGTCVNVGCVPKKLLVMASHVRDELDDALGFGWTIDGAHFDWPTLIASKDRELARLRGFYRKGLDQAGVTIIEARAELVDAHTVAASDRRITAQYILIATGGRAEKPAGMEHAITSDDAFSLPTLPRHVLIYGAGYIGVEFAGVFRGLGSDVTLMHRGSQLLRGFDNDIGDALAAAMTKRGVALHHNVDVAAVSRVTSTLPTQPELTLCATGRVPNTRGLGLRNAGVAVGEGGDVLVDATSRTSVAHIFAVGDCTNRVQLTPVAIADGHAVADSLFGGQTRDATHDIIPTAVFSQPTVATVGLSEESARERFDDVHIYQALVRPMKDTLGGREERALFKLVIDGATDRVVGCHIVGPSADEIIQGFAVAMRCGVTKSQLDSTVGIHPSLAEDLLTIRTRTR